MRLGLREANQHFSRAINAVRAGRDVVLTERGHPIAIIKPVKNEKVEQAALQAMVHEGLVRRAARTGPTPMPRWRPLKVQGPPVAQTIIEDREDSA
jgi:prevent-host-death family protein